MDLRKPSVTNSPFFFQCINESCGQQFSIDQKIYRCSVCADLLDIIKPPVFTDVPKVKQLFRERASSNHPLDISGVWRYREFLPFTEADYDQVITLGEGNIPILEAPRSAEYVGLKRLRVKHLGWNPTGSFKDLGMTVGVSQAKKLGTTVVACASTGNTSSSMSAYCARAGIRPVVFVPHGQIAYGKLAQTLDYGAVTVQLEGDFDEAMKLIYELSNESSLYLMNSINPFRIEGQKTAVIELFDQLNWEIPDRIVLPGGNLGNSSSYGKALTDLKDAGFIEKIPRITIIQARGAAALFRTLVTSSSELVAVDNAWTLASGIKIGRPISWKKAVRTLSFTDGWCDVASEQEIADAKAVLGRDGIGCEPASATTVAGLKKLLRVKDLSQEVNIDPGEDVVAILTGHQLKDPEYTLNYHMDDLYERASYEYHSTEKSGKIRSNFANPPITLPSDKNKLLDFLNLR